jgi:uncharacterized protein (DUF3820 family)
MGQRRLRVYLGSICILVLTIAFVFLGLYANPSIQQWVEKAMGGTAKPQIEYGMKQFQYAVNSTVTITVKISYEVLGDAISVGKPVWLLSNVTVSGNPYFTVWSVSMQPANVLESPYGATIIGFNGPSINSGGQTVWFGSGLVIFDVAGPLVATVTLTIYPTSATKWTSIDIPFYTVIPEISIAPSRTETLFDENQSLSLIFFVLFSNLSSLIMWPLLFMRAAWQQCLWTSMPTYTAISLLHLPLRFLGWFERGNHLSARLGAFMEPLQKFAHSHTRPFSGHCLLRLTNRENLRTRA